MDLEESSIARIITENSATRQLRPLDAFLAIRVNEFREAGRGGSLLASSPRPVPHRSVSVFIGLEVVRAADTPSQEWRHGVGGYCCNVVFFDRSDTLAAPLVPHIAERGFRSQFVESSTL